MKNSLILSIIVSLLAASCSKNNSEPIETLETAPSIPSLVFPTHNLVCTNYDLEFKWQNSTDPEGDTISYEINISEGQDFNAVVFKQTVSGNAIVFTLEQATTYFWRVRAVDSNSNESEFSPTWEFFTEPEAGQNAIPFAPGLVAPQIGSSLNGITTQLSWDALDLDNDPLLYDLYFGTQNPPPIYSENMDSSSKDVSISPNQHYYWRIVAKDDKQGVAIGQVWNFKTE